MNGRVGLTLIWDAYGASFTATAIGVAVIAAALLLGLYALIRKRRGRPWGRVVPALLVVVALVAGLAGGVARVLQQAGGLQRQEGTVVTLDDDTNNFPGQTEVDVAAFDGLIDRVGEDRLREMKGRFDGADMIGRHRLRVEHGYTATDMLAYYVWRMKGQAGEQDAAKGNAYYRAVMELDPRAIDAAEKAGAADPENPMHGAIVAGRTNLSEFANFLTTGGPNGFSGRGGQALSPQGPLTVDPLGSSTGSATAIALDYADVTVGTETSGSVLDPAGAAGVVGVKAAHDSCSISGIVPIDDRVDSVGFLGRSTRDVQLALDAGCTAGAPAEESAGDSTKKSTEKPAASPAKIMVLGEVPQSLRDRAKKANIDVVEAPEKIVDLVADVDMANSEEILLGGFGPSLETHLRGSGGTARTATDVAKYYRDHPDTAPYGHSTLDRATEVDVAGREAGEKELRRIKKLVADVDSELRAAGVDALVTSSTDLASFSLAGVPRISVPLEKKNADDVTGKESPEVAFQVTAARTDALPQVLAIAAALGAAL